MGLLTDPAPPSPHCRQDTLPVLNGGLANWASYSVCRRTMFWKMPGVPANSS